MVSSIIYVPCTSNDWRHPNTLRMWGKGCQTPSSSVVVLWVRPYLILDPTKWVLLATQTIAKVALRSSWTDGRSPQEVVLAHHLLFSMLITFFRFMYVLNEVRGKNSAWYHLLWGNWGRDTHTNKPCRSYQTDVDACHVSCRVAALRSQCWHIDVAQCLQGIPLLLHRSIVVATPALIMHKSTREWKILYT